MAYTFDEVLQAFDTAKSRRPERWAGADVYQFAQEASRVDPGFSPVAQSNVVQRFSRDLDQLIAGTGLPQQSGEFFGRLASIAGPKAEEAGRAAGAMLPRQIVNLLPWALGPLGKVASVGLSGADIYTQTGSPLAAAIGTVAPPLTFAAMRPAGQLALGALAKGGAKVGISEAGAYVPQGVAQRLTEFLGRQAGGYAAGEAVGEAISVATGQGLYDPTSPEAIVSNLVGTLPFSGLDAADYLKEVRPTIARYSTDRQTDIQRPASEVPEFTPRASEKDDLVVKQLLESQARLNEIGKLDPTPELKAEKATLLKNITSLAYQRKPLPSSEVTGGVITPGEQLELFDPTTIAQIQSFNASRNKNDASSLLDSTKTANGVLKTETEEGMASEIQGRSSVGETSVQAVNRTVQKRANRAKDKGEVRERIGSGTDRDRKVRMEEFNRYLEGLPEDQKKVVADAVAEVQRKVDTTRVDPAAADMKFHGTVLRWDGKDPERLKKSLNAALNFANKPRPEKGERVEIFPSRLDAKIAADDLNTAEGQENIRYTVRSAGKGSPKGSYEVRKETWATKIRLVEEKGEKVMTQAEWDEDNFVGDVLEAGKLPDEGETVNKDMVRGIQSRVDDTVGSVLDLSNGEIQRMGYDDPDLFRKAFGIVDEVMRTGSLKSQDVQRLFDERGVELDAVDFLTEPATVELFGHMVKKVWGGDLVRGSDGKVYEAREFVREQREFGERAEILKNYNNGLLTEREKDDALARLTAVAPPPLDKIPSFPVQVRNLLGVWFEEAGFRPEEVETLTRFGMWMASLTDKLDDVNLGVLKSLDPSLMGLSEIYGTKIWLRDVAKHPEALLATLAHELGHQVSQEHFQGRVPVEWKQRWDNASRFFKDLGAEDTLRTLEVLREALPQAFRDDPFMTEILKKSSLSPEEAVGQATGMVMLGASGQGRGWRRVVEMLPKPVADWVFHVLDVAKATLDGLSAAAWYGQNPFAEFKRSKEFRGNLTEFRRTLDLMWKTQKDLEYQVGQLMSLENQTPEGLSYLAQTLENPLEVSTLREAVYKPAAVSAGSWMFNRHSQEAEDWYVDKKYLVKGALKSFFQNFTPVRTLKELYPEAAVLFGIPLVQQRRVEQVTEQVFTPFNMKFKEGGASVVDDKGEILGRIAASEKLQRVVSDIRRDMNLKAEKYTDADLERQLGGLSSKDRETVYSYVKSMTLAEESMRGIKRQSRVGNVQKVAATIILKRSPGVGAANALRSAQHVWGAMETGDLVQLQAASTLLGSNTFLETYGFFQNLKKSLAEFQRVEDANPLYTTEKRLGRFVINYVKTDGYTDTIAFDDVGKWERAQERLNNDLTVSKVEAIDSEQYHARFGIKQELLNAADKYDQQVVENIRALLPEDEFDKVRPYLGIKNELLKEFAQQSPSMLAGLPADVTKQLRREFKAEREGLNLVRNQMRNLAARTHEVAKADARGDLMLNMSDPKQTYDRRADLVELVHRNYENYQIPDTQIGTMTNLGAFTYFLGGNLSNMAMEGAQWLVTLPSILTEVGVGNNKGRGVGLVESWDRTLKAAGEVAKYYQKGKKWEDKELLDLMEQASYEIDRTTGTMEEVISKDSMALINSMRMGKGLGPVSVGSLMGNPLAHYMSFMRKMYQIPSGLNNRIALVAGYKLARDRGLEHQAAVDDAKRVTYLANFNEGKAGRMIGPFSNKTAIGRTVAQMLMSLQTYSIGMVSTFGRQVYNAFSKRTDLTVGQRRQARRALLQLGATQFAIAGTLGLPFVGASLAVLNSMFDINAEEDVRKTIALLGGHDKELGGMISRFAMDGVLNQVVPVDIASRYGLGNIAGLSSYDGWSLENLFGPVGSMLATEFKAAGQLVQGNMGQAFENAVPIGFKNVTKLYRDDWKVLDNEGRLLLEPTQAETFMRAIGFSPQRLSQQYRAQRMMTRGKAIDAKKRKEFRTELADLVEGGDDVVAQQKLLQRQVEDPTFDPNYEVRQVSEMLIGRRFRQELRGEAETARLLGVEAPPAREFERLQLSDEVKARLGFGRPSTKKQRGRAVSEDVLSSMGMFPEERELFLKMF